jgi:hypothetical protein
MTTVLDPTGERQVARARPPRTPASLEGKVVGLLDITKPRGDVFLDRLEQLLRRRGRRRRALRQADLHQAGAGRPPPRDRHQLRVRPGDRGPRRLRVVHVVQCARHRDLERRGVPGCSSRRASSSTPPPPRPRPSGSTRRGCSWPTPSRTAPTTRCAPSPSELPDRSAAPPLPRTGSRIAEITGPQRTTFGHLCEDIVHVAGLTFGELHQAAPRAACSRPLAHPAVEGLVTDR